MARARSIGTVTRDPARSVGHRVAYNPGPEARPSDGGASSRRPAPTPVPVRKPVSVTFPALLAGVAWVAASGIASAAQAVPEPSPAPVRAAAAAAHGGDEALARRLLACTGCHGKEGRATADGWYPRIAGKPAGYLFNQLRHFRDGRRGNPAMAWMVAWMTDDYLREIAAHFAAQHPPYPPPQAPTAAAAQLARGRELALRGDPARQVPACATCHGEALTGVAPFVPGLLGLPRDYLNAQFGAWRNGARRADAPDCMGEIARRLGDEDMAAASAWLATQPVPADGIAPPAPAGFAAALPMRCGSVPR